MHPNLSIESTASSIRKTFRLQHHDEGCPPGKVPIQRIKSKNVIDAEFMLPRHADVFHQFTKEFPGQHFATMYTRAPYSFMPYHGARATVDIHNPSVEMNQFSMAQIWVQNRHSSDLNSLQADNYQKTGCYNMMCPGFVQVHPTKRLGQSFKGISIIGGEQWVIDILISQDKSTGNWWLTIYGDEKIGYWPKEIFTHLGDGANYLEYGGWTYNSPSGISPPMGSGKFPSNNYTVACWFAQIRYVNEVYREDDVHRLNMVKYNTDANCYDLKYLFYAGKILGHSFSFGGPGGNCIT
ncbi:Protein of Unknown Function (DUF239) [Quillaja saponaria]|uniref:Neprosin PEP catalytic domain-containing protein n=1 Tax=Quillaja saponaria TaxID=32244 RepID=A0AAD7LDQ0_QUISA|nr:Protein of Unknown Function (DUF239) [Quillaja saponaria]